MPYCMPMFPAAAFGISIGTVSGLTRFGPPRLADVLLLDDRLQAAHAGGEEDADAVAVVVVHHQPGLRAMASPAAATANCPKRSIRRAARASMWSVGSKPLTSPAMCVSRPSSTGSKRVMRPIPDSPALSRGQVSGHGVREGVDRTHPGDHHAPSFHVRSSDP